MIVGEAHVAVRGQVDPGQFESDVSKGTVGPLKNIARSAAGIIAAGFAGSKVAGFFTSAVAGARESNRVAAQTEAVLRSTGHAAGVTAGQVGDLAAAISNKTGIDDEQIQSAENLILTFTNLRDQLGEGNDIFTQATQAAVDMGAALGTDASGSAIQLGKALQDPILGVTALTRVGVNFTAAQKAQIKALVESGDALEAQKIILAELTTEFGGSAGAQATAAGRMNVAFDGLKEQIGESLVPAIERIASAITTTAIPAFQQLFSLGPAPDKPLGWVDAVKDGISDGVGFVAGFGQQAEKLVANIADVFGGDGIAGKYRDAADALGEFRKEAHSSEEEVRNLGAATRNQRIAAQVTAPPVRILAEALGDFEVSAEDAAKATLNHRDVLLEARTATLALRGATQDITRAQRDAADAQDELNVLLATGGIEREAVKKAEDDLTAAQGDYEAAVRKTIAAQKDLDDALRPAQTRDLAKAQRDLEDAQDGVLTSGQRLKAAQTELGVLQVSGTATADQLEAAQIRVRDAQRGVADASDNVIDRQERLSGLQQVGSVESDAYKEAVERLDDAQRLAAEKAAAQTGAQQGLNTSQGIGEDFARKLEDAQLKLRDANQAVEEKTLAAEKATNALKDKVAESKGVVDGYAGSLNGIPDVVKTTVELVLEGVKRDTGNILGGTGVLVVGVPVGSGPAPTAGAPFDYKAWLAAQKLNFTPFALGGFTTETGPAFLHRREVVLPLDNPTRTGQLLGQAGLAGTVINAPVTIEASFGAGTNADDVIRGMTSVAEGVMRRVLEGIVAKAQSGVGRG